VFRQTLERGCFVDA